MALLPVRVCRQHLTTQPLFTVLQFQSTVGTRKGRRGRNLALRPDEPAAMHELMAEDATPNLRVWQVRPLFCALNIIHASHSANTAAAQHAAKL